MKLFSGRSWPTRCLTNLHLVCKLLITLGLVLSKTAVERLANEPSDPFDIQKSKVNGEFRLLQNTDIDTTYSKLQELHTECTCSGSTPHTNTPHQHNKRNHCGFCWSYTDILWSISSIRWSGTDFLQRKGRVFRKWSLVSPSYYSSEHWLSLFHRVIWSLREMVEKPSGGLAQYKQIYIDQQVNIR